MVWTWVAGAGSCELCAAVQTSGFLERDGGGCFLLGKKQETVGIELVVVGQAYGVRCWTEVL